jgi:hypothetical protein
MASADAARRERRRKRAEIGWDGKLPYKDGGDIEGLEKPTLEKLRSLRSELYSASSRKRRVVPASRMISSSILRSSFSHSKPISKHRHKSAHSHGSETERKSHRKRKATSRDDESSYISVYGPPRPRERPTTVKVPERRTSRRDEVSSGSSERRPRAMSAVSEESVTESESEPEPKPERKARKVKVKVIYVTERPKSSRRSSHKLVEEDGKRNKDDVKTSANSVHRSNTTSSHKLRSQSAQDVRESRPVLKRSHTLSASYLPPKPLYEPSLTGAKNTNRRPTSSFFGLFAPSIKEEKPPRL